MCVRVCSLWYELRGVVILCVRVCVHIVIILWGPDPHVIPARGFFLHAAFVAWRVVPEGVKDKLAIAFQVFACALNFPSRSQAHAGN